MMIRRIATALLERTDIGARQIPVSRHETVGELLDPGADLHHQHHGP